MRIQREHRLLRFHVKGNGSCEKVFKQKNGINIYVGMKDYSTSKTMNRLDINKLLSKFRNGSDLPPSGRVFLLPLNNERCANGDGDFFFSLHWLLTAWNQVVCSIAIAFFHQMNFQFCFSSSFLCILSNLIIIVL